MVDDFDLPLGRIRMRAEGSAGTHNGLRSIIGELGTQKFARLRVGIGQPDRGAKDHVLSRFAAEEREVLDKVLDAAADAVEDWARYGAERAANKWNGWRGRCRRAAPPLTSQPTRRCHRQPSRSDRADNRAPLDRLAPAAAARDA